MLWRWAGLNRFLGDGRIEIDSNAAERSSPAPNAKPRPTALSRWQNSRALKVLRHQRYVLQRPKIPCYARPSLFSKSLWFSRGREYQISFELNRVIIEALHLQQSVEGIPYTGAEEFG